MIKKYSVFLIVAFMILNSCQNSNKINKELLPKKAMNLKSEILFEVESKNFGIRKQGEKVEINFHFKNAGKESLVIYEIQTGCNCTVAAWPEKPVEPGDSETISINFDTNEKKGLQKNPDDFLE